MILGDYTTQYIGNYHNPLAKSPGIPTINQSAGVATSAHQVRSLGSGSALILEFSKPLGPSSHKPKVQEGTIREILRVKEKGLQLSYLYFSHLHYDIHHVFPFYHFTNRIGPPVLGSLWTGGAWHGSGWRLTSGAGWWPKKPRRSCSRSDRDGAMCIFGIGHGWLRSWPKGPKLFAKSPLKPVPCLGRCLYFRGLNIMTSLWNHGETFREGDVYWWNA